jgi:hypothetical protein
MGMMLILQSVEQQAPCALNPLLCNHPSYQHQLLVLIIAGPHRLLLEV